jgi:hypothetical protein
MKRLRRAALGAAVFVAVSLAMTTAGTAFASPERAAAATSSVAPLVLSCPVGDTCLWVDKNFGGYANGYSGSEPDFTVAGGWLPGCAHVEFNDCASSAWNNGQHCTVYLWTDVGYHGRYHSLGLGDAVSNFASSAGPPTGFADPSFNDAVSSLHWCTPR